MLMFEMIRSMLRNEKGQGMVEYGLIISLIAVALVGAMSALGTDLDGFFRGLAISIGL